MLSIQNLLNPEPATTPNAKTISQTRSKQTNMTDRVLTAPATASIRYSPSPIYSKGYGNNHHDAQLAYWHTQFHLMPGNRQQSILDTSRRYPYSSDKKRFLEKIGREAFIVFEYEFRLPAEQDTTYTVLWDYETGLVRLTPFFKACKHSKTVPNKALMANAGLKENLCISVTGGALAAQGYWTTFECARALCTTFCYHIRWALTPIFGDTFIDDCYHPDDPRFEKFKIDRSIIDNALIDVEQWEANAAQIGKEMKQTNSVESSNSKERSQSLRSRIKTTTETSTQQTTEASSSALLRSMDSPQVSPKTTVNNWTPVNETVLGASASASASAVSASVSPLSLPTTIAPAFRSKIRPKKPARSKKRVRPIDEVDSNNSTADAPAGSTKPTVIPVLPSSSHHRSQPKRMKLHTLRDTSLAVYGTDLTLSELGGLVGMLSMRQNDPNKPKEPELRFTLALSADQPAK